MAKVDILTGDAREVIATSLADASVQCCVTSPPYYGLRDYGCAGQIGLEPTPDAYVTKMVGVFREVWRVLRDDGTCWLNIGDSYAANRSYQVGQTKHKSHGIKPKDLLGIPWRVAFALQADGWYLRSEIIWHKINPMPESVKDRPASAHEKVFLLTKRSTYFYDADAIKEEMTASSISRCAYPRYQNAKKDPSVNYGNPRTDEATRVRQASSGMRNARNVWTISPKSYSGAHFATMPPGLAERCIKAGSRPGDTILDPFGGAGTTGLVANQLGRDSILIELNPEYVELAKNRIYPN